MDEDVAVVLELRVECDRPEPLLDKSGLKTGTKRVEVGQINKWFRQYLAVLVNDSDATGALDHKYAPGTIVCGCDADWIVKSVGDFGECQLRSAIFPPGCATSAGIAGTCCADATGIPKHKYAAAQKAASDDVLIVVDSCSFPGRLNYWLDVQPSTILGAFICAATGEKPKLKRD